MFPAPIRVSAVVCGLALLGLNACAAPPDRPAAPPAPAARPDIRADAAPLLERVIAKIDEQGSAHTTVRGSLGMLGELASEGTARFQRPLADLTVRGHIRMSDAQTHPVQVTVADGIGYVKSPLMRSQPEQPWLKVVPGTHDGPTKLLAPAMAQIQAATDPRFAFAGVEQATKIQSSGPEQVNGQPTTRYDLRVNTAHAAKTTTNPRQRAQLRQAADNGQAELGYRLWLDESGVPVRFSATREIDQAGEVSLTTSFQDWATGTDIRPPAPEEVGTFAQSNLPHTPR